LISFRTIDCDTPRRSAISFGLSKEDGGGASDLQPFSSLNSSVSARISAARGANAWATAARIFASICSSVDIAPMESPTGSGVQILQRD